MSKHSSSQTTESYGVQQRSRCRLNSILPTPRIKSGGSSNMRRISSIYPHYTTDNAIDKKTPPAQLGEQEQIDKHKRVKQPSKSTLCNETNDGHILSALMALTVKHRFCSPRPFSPLPSSLQFHSLPSAKSFHSRRPTPSFWNPALPPPPKPCAAPP